MNPPEDAVPTLDKEEEFRARRNRINRIAKWTLPSLVMALSLLAWHLYVTLNDVPHYVLPGPVPVAKSIFEDWALLCPAMLTTSRLTILALFLAVTGGVSLAVAFTQSRWAEMSFFPYAVILQVTPVVAIAPLAADLRGQRLRRGTALRMDRGLLPDPLQHDNRPQVRRPQPA